MKHASGLKFVKNIVKFLCYIKKTAYVYKLCILGMPVFRKEIYPFWSTRYILGIYIGKEINWNQLLSYSDAYLDHIYAAVSRLESELLRTRKVDDVATSMDNLFFSKQLKLAKQDASYLRKQLQDTIKDV